MPTSTKVDAIRTRLSGLLGRGAATIEASPVGSEAFFVVKQADGRSRWVSFSSNSFIDREKEIVSADALNDAVAFADKTGRRGPLRLYHVPKADVGACDFQAVEGRFLVESGLFDQTPAGRAAEKYFSNCKERMGVSIGFAYRQGTFDGRVYRQARIFERSVAPWNRVANPYTGFTLSGETPMEKAKQDWLTEVLGEDIAGDIIGAASAATKELETLVSFKTEQEAKVEAEKAPAKGDMSAADEEDMMDGGSDESSEDANGKKKEAPASDEAVKQLAAIIAEPMAAMVESIKTLGEVVKTLTEKTDQLMEERKVAAAEKSAAPKGAAFRASESSTNTLDKEETKKVLGDTTDKPVNPATAYLNDLKAGLRSG